MHVFGLPFIVFRTLEELFRALFKISKGYIKTSVSYAELRKTIEDLPLLQLRLSKTQYPLSSSI